MNTKAIIASLVLGTSSVAMAAPSVTFTATGDKYGATTATVRDHGDAPRTLPAYESGYQPVYRPAQPVQPARPSYRGGWFTGGWNGGWNNGHRPVVQPVAYQAPVTLASALSFRGSDDRKFINVGAQAGRFGKLELNAAGGRTFIKQVYVQFENGQEQVIRNLDRTLTGGECLTLDLDGSRRAIKRIVVYGTELRSWRRAPGAFSVTAA